MRPGIRLGLSARLLYLLTILHIVWVVLYLLSLVSFVHDYGLKDSWTVGRLRYGFEFTEQISRAGKPRAGNVAPHKPFPKITYL